MGNGEVVAVAVAATKEDELRGSSMEFCVIYAEEGASYTWYSATRKEAEDLALRLIAEGRENVTVVAPPNRSDALAHLIMAKSTKPPLWMRTPQNHPK